MSRPIFTGSSGIKTLCSGMLGMGVGDDMVVAVRGLAIVMG